jgi:hypothetical protein
MQNASPKLSATPSNVHSPAPQKVVQYYAQVYGGLMGLDDVALVELKVLRAT